MSTVWTEEQEKVICHREGNLLVAAAAGSGKTAVLVEHVLQRITDAQDPVSLQELVVMTFTEAAAEEMRERIRKALLERLQQCPGNERLIRESANIQNASISTIHSFCKRLITENYAAADIDPGARIGEEGELKLLKSDLIQSLLEEYYEAGDEDFVEFVDSFSRDKTDLGIQDLILKLYEYAEANPWPEEYLAHAGEEGESGEAFLLELYRSEAEDGVLLLENAMELAREEDGPQEYLPTLSQELENLKRLLQAETLEAWEHCLESIAFSAIGRSRSEKREPVKQLRDTAKKIVIDMQGALVRPDPETEQQMHEGIHRGMQVLLRLTAEFLHRFEEAKKKRHLMDFSDLEHYALRILYTGEGEGRQPSVIADDLAQSIREILVDEYQDSNLVQEKLIQAISGERFGRPDVFQVGDVKQSIYSFRLARPDLFLSKYMDPEYPCIRLSRNFRSRSQVLEAVNQVFFRIMKRAAGGITYDADAALYPGRVPEEDGRDYCVELHLTETSGEQEDGGTGNSGNAGKEETESALIADRIQRLLKEGYRYRDMVILMRSPGSWADTCVEVLGAHGIPAYSVTSTGYFSTVEVETVLSMLRVIDNPRQDIPVAAVMHSPIYDFSDEELAAIKASRGSLCRSFPGEQELRQGMTSEGQELPSAGEVSEEVSEGFSEKASKGFSEGLSEKASEALSEELEKKLSAFYESIDHFRRLSEYLSVHELLYRIYDETGYYRYVSAMPAGKRRSANLDQLVNSALSFEKTSYCGLFDYIRYIEKLRKYNEDQGEASIYSEQDDLVRIMSIHKSKGLQFKVVFLAGMDRRFNTSDLNERILVDPVLGLATDYIDPEKRVRIPSLKRLAVREKLLTDQIGEELRVLYVGMTRAEDKLIMTAACSNVERKLGGLQDRSVPVSGTAIRGARSYLELLMLAEGDRLLSTSGPIRLFTGSAAQLALQETAALQEQTELSFRLREELDRLLPEDPEQQRLQQLFGFRYAYEPATTLYPKHSVSEIKEDTMRSGILVRQEQEEQKERQERKGQKEEKEQKELEAQEGARENGQQNLPEQGTVSAGAQVGNAYHHALAAYDYEGTMEQLDKLLPEAEIRLIRPELFRRFLETGLAERFREAQRRNQLFREQHFMKKVPYNYLFRESDITEPVLLQGIIDAFFLEEDGIVLVDYKSDRVSDPEVLKERYRIQLELYGDALEEMLQRPVKEKLLYSIHLGMEIPLQP